MAGKRPRPTDPIVMQRVAEVLQLRLDGAEAWDVRRYVAEREAAGEIPWTIPEGGNPLSERQIRNYVQSADQQIAATLRQSRATLLRRHVALRKNLYRRALAAEDWTAAQSVLADLAKLEDLYPANKVSVNVGEIDRAIEQLLANLGPQGETPPAADAGAAGAGNPPGEAGA
jgi:hypothetical protein